MQCNGVDICVIEDDADQRRLLLRRLTRWGYSVAEAENGTDGLHQIYEKHPRVVISDIVLPDLSGLQLCRRVRSDPTLDGTYLIAATAFPKDGQKGELLKAGADDYVHKPYDLEELGAQIRNGLRYSHLQERLRHAALTDGLTGLWNHSQFRSLLELELSRSRRYGGSVSLLMIDLDHFKAVNDTFGHETGNVILVRTAEHLRNTVRDTDIVSRYGGEEFAVVCPETSISDAAHLAERIRATFPDAVPPPKIPHLRVTASIGVANSEDKRVTSVTDLVNIGDQALYASKRAGRNRVTRFDECADLLKEAPPDLPNEVDRLRKEVAALSMRSKELCLQSVWSLIQALEARDGYSAWHSRNVTVYTNWLARAANWSEPLRVAVTNAAMLHDLGKIGVPDDLLMKPQPLTIGEAAIMRQVPLITCQILKPLRVFDSEIQIIRHLRERYDGGGYPDGLGGKEIPIGSRLLAITEAFDSMTCNRAYRPGRSLERAIEMIREEADQQFDGEFVELLCRAVDLQPSRWQNRIDRARVELPEHTNQHGLHPVALNRD